MVVRWNDVVESDKGISSTILERFPKTGSECQTEPFPTVFVIHHITNKIPWFQTNNVTQPDESFVVKQEKSPLHQIENIPLFDEKELIMSEKNEGEKRLAEG